MLERTITWSNIIKLNVSRTSNILAFIGDRKNLGMVYTLSMTNEENVVLDLYRIVQDSQKEQNQYCSMRSLKISAIWAEVKQMKLKKLWMVNWQENKFCFGSIIDDKEKGFLQQNKSALNKITFSLQTNKSFNDAI